MGLFAHPRVARLAGRAMQRATHLAERPMARRAQARLPDFVCTCEAITIPSALGQARAWIYRPPIEGPQAQEGLPAVHLNLHGGGFVMGLPQLDDALCRALGALAGVIVINVDYALAPDHPFPQPPEHAYEIATWVAANGEAWGWDGARLTVGGQSAGGGLAAAVARLALERGGPRISLQVLHYPPLDLITPVRAKPSPLARPRLRPWMGDVFDTCYVPDEDFRTDRLASPAMVGRVLDLAGIAPAVIIAAEQDILRSEAERYAARLRDVRALVDFHLVPGRDHGYDLDDDAAARATYELIGRHLRSAVSDGATSDRSASKRLN
jgi:acetyl esterase/lipase